MSFCTRKVRLFCSQSEHLASQITLLLLLFNIQLFAGDPLDQWHWRNPLPDGRLLVDVAFGNGAFVAVGDAGAVAVSQDGTNWADFQCPPMASPLGASYGLGDSCYGGGMFVASGSGRLPGPGGSFGVITTSLDATNWTIPQRIDGTSSIQGVAYGDGVFVGIGYGSSGFDPIHAIVYTSPDARNWTQHDLAVFKAPAAITFGNGRFVLVGEKGLILTSANGTDWTDGSLNVDRQLSGVTYANGLFVAVGGQTIATSTDGEQWARVAIDFTGSDVAFGANTFVAVGAGGTIYTSINGTNWSKVALGTTDGLRSVAYGNGRFVAIDIGMRLTSSDGLIWTLPASQAIPFYSLYFDVAYGSGRFVAVGGPFFDPVPIVSSVDGVAWSRAAGTDSFTTFSGVAFGANTFVAVGDGGAISTSTNGLDWFSRKTGSTATFKTTCYGDSRFVAVGSGGAMLVSSNAVDWVAPGIGINNDLLAITFGQDRFVLGGANGVLLTSTNGYKWDFQVSGTQDLILGLAYGNGTFVATTPGAVFTSTNAIDWTNSFSGSGFSGGRVRYGHGTFVNVAGETQTPGSIWTSTNGVNWQKRESPTTTSLGGIAFGHRTFVAVGFFGSVIQSSELPAPELTLENRAETQTNGLYSIIGRGTPGENWQIQVSQDLAEWEPLVDFFNPDPLFQFLDHPPFDHQQRFYRAVGR